ncbi:SLC13 family permease [Cytobacillus purgationiresistens]|uniref:Sodium-dependent dicarboxylate transporter SdcS n=1 Tax=Cytobacillus purgationiresistens TaxID=863449 RepID=A0ABU0AMK4_9BACI|nr:DASS family sodium-coupled anion symporter [Cytobacillus purgationiresistens]MDQ0271280.1 sodium-dependent dicarboxylate transporter 2/3/5 [Cytobacillus purgationiresistens]
MEKSFRTLSQSLWSSHERTKDLLTFASLRQTKPESTSKGRKSVDAAASNGGNNKQEKPSYTKSQLVGLLLGPLLFLITIFLLPLPGLSESGRAVLAITLWVSTWWILEAMPLGITSLMPIILLPFMGAITGAEATASYGDPNIFLFLGGFAIALALEKWKLHERIALTIISFVGTSTSGLVYGFMFATGFLSMWISNVATVMMMIPIGTAIAFKVVELMKKEGTYTQEEDKKFTKSIVFAIGFGGIIGGSATLIGTPPNLILAGLIKEMYGIEISFAKWFIFAFPLTLILAIFAAFYLTKIAFPMKVKRLERGRQFVLDEKIALGRMTYEEKIVSFVFGFTAFMWLTRTFIWTDIIPGISDTMIAMTGAILLYLIPASKKNGGRILESDSLKHMPWDVLLLVGGGLAIAAGFSGTDLSNWIGSQLLLLEGTPYIIILAITTILTISITQIAPNTAITTIFVPIAATLALAINAHPLPLMTAAALGAGFAFMLPIGTPSQAIVFGTGKVTIMDMLRKGTWITILATILIITFVYFLFPVVFDLNLLEFPTELK